MEIIKEGNSRVCCVCGTEFKFKKEDVRFKLVKVRNKVRLPFKRNVHFEWLCLVICQRCGCSVKL